ncbi:hypothetical protein S1OALGB6SA_308 [Olavius algarvensis spirochete endosymbiont]|nr:hypothetical protein S1OALGB6SA_308 [Olavius algarvensis spirochete endosymbiont]
MGRLRIFCFCSVDSHWHKSMVEKLRDSLTFIQMTGFGDDQ